MDRLIPPTTDDERYRPMLPPILHIMKLPKDSIDTSADSPTDETVSADSAAAVVSDGHAVAEIAATNEDSSTASVAHPEDANPFIDSSNNAAVDHDKDAFNDTIPIVTTMPPSSLDALDSSLADDFIEMFPWANNCGCSGTSMCSCESPEIPDDSPSSTPPSSRPSASDPSDIPKECDCAGCCLAALPPDMPNISGEVVEKLKYIQRLGFQ